MWDNSDTPRKASITRKRVDRVFGPGTLLFKRITIDIQVAQELGIPARQMEGRVVLNDLDPQGLWVFTTEAINSKQEVRVQISYPKPLSVYGKIVCCIPVEKSNRIHSAQNFAYRIRIDFMFLNEVDAQALREYCAQLAGPLQQVKKAA